MKRLINWFRTILGINQDIENVAKDITTLAMSFDKLNQDVFAIFNTLPFSSGILKMTAADAAKITNPMAMEQNALLPLLTAIALSARQGQSSLQVNGELSTVVSFQLKERGFKIEEVQGANDNEGLFILWT